MRELTPEETTEAAGGLSGAMFEPDYQRGVIRDLERILTPVFPEPPDVCLGFYC